MRGGIFLRKMPLGVYVSVKSRIETAVVALCFVETSGSVLWGQSQAASIVGVVTGPDGNAIPNATISVSSPALQLTNLTTTTDSQGAYKVPNQQCCA
jgi:hypothetical protein